MFRVAAEERTSVGDIRSLRQVVHGRRESRRQWMRGIRRDLRGGDVGIRLLSGEVLHSGKTRFALGPSWSGAGTFEVYLWAGRNLSVEIELSGNEEGLVGRVWYDYWE